MARADTVYITRAGQMSSIDRKEQARIKQAAINQLPHRKEYRRQASNAKSKEHKVNTTEKRFAEHTMAELMYIARKKYTEAGIDFATCESDVARMLAILHGTPIVLSGVHNHTICAPTSE